MCNIVLALVNDIVNFLGQQHHPDNLIGCSKVFHPVVRRDGKWNMPVESYPTDQYPLGCVGWCFVLSANVIRDLYFMSLDTPLIFLEDVTTTGILREKVQFMDTDRGKAKTLGNILVSHSNLLCLKV